MKSNVCLWSKMIFWSKLAIILHVFYMLSSEETEELVKDRRWLACISQLHPKLLIQIQSCSSSFLHLFWGQNGSSIVSKPAYASQECVPGNATGPMKHQGATRGTCIGLTNVGFKPEAYKSITTLSSSLKPQVAIDFEKSQTHSHFGMKQPSSLLGDIGLWEFVSSLKVDHLFPLNCLVKLLSS